MSCNTYVWLIIINIQHRNKAINKVKKAKKYINKILFMTPNIHMFSRKTCNSKNQNQYTLNLTQTVKIKFKKAKQ